MGMKFACQHLLCRRDLSCTKVNAVNRLSDCLDSSFGLRREEAAPPAAAECTRKLLLGARAQARLLIMLWENWWAGQLGQNKETQLSRLVSVLSK